MTRKASNPKARPLHAAKHQVIGATAAMLAICTPITAQNEGLKLAAYLDPVGIPTICYGDTENVKLGDKKSKEECDALLIAKLGFFGWWVDYYVEPEMTPQMHAGLTDFAYNVGVGKFKSSTVLELINDGKKKEGCEFMRKFIYAKGKRLQGLVDRREKNVKLCLYEEPVQ